MSSLTRRYFYAVDKVFVPSIIFPPIGSYVMAVGTLVAAIAHNLPIQYIETVRYDFDLAKSAVEAATDLRVHLLLSGTAYRKFGVNANAEGATPNITMPEADLPG